MTAQRKFLFTVIALLSLSLFIINRFIPVYFYFGASLAAHKQWFPDFYLLTFLCFNLYAPVSYGFWILLLTDYLNIQRWKGFLIILIQSLFLLYTLQYPEIGFGVVAVYAYLLLAISVVIGSYRVLQRFYYRLSRLSIFSNENRWRYLIFASYIILCLCLSEFYPFSKYPMYNKFPNSSYLFFLCDNHQRMVPLNKYFKVDGGELGHLYISLLDLHHYTNPTKENTDTIGKEMFGYILSTKYRQPPFDTMSLNRTFFHLENGKIISDELEMYKSKVE